MIFVPPDAPTTIFTLFSLSKMIVGHMEDSGLLPATNRQNVVTTAYNDDDNNNETFYSCSNFLSVTKS